AEMAGDGIELNGLTALEAALYAAGRTDLLAGLASGFYDSSADYWRLMSDGSLVQDKDGWLRDENDNFILDKDGNKIGSDGQETGLLNILFSKQTDGSYKNPGKAYNDFNLLEKIISSEIMEKSGISYCYEDEAKSGIYNRMWNKDGKALDMNLVMGYAGDSVATAVFARYYDSTVDALYAKSHKLDADIANTQQVTNAASNRFNTLYDVKRSFYDSIGAFFESENTKITGDYGKEIQDPTKNPKDYYKNYNNLHYGIDIIRWLGSDDLYLGISGKILQNDWNPAEGWTVQSNYGYNFEDSYISTGIYGEYGHLAKKSDLQVNKYYNANDKVGLFGNTGNKSTGAHLHYSIYTQNSYYSDSTMRIVLGKNYQMGSMYNGSWRTVYDPTKLYERYKK
ncbi:MAG: M23 family metallopeptidase, partial [Treponemataceae bacterium]|nr:M23 family metallopeptidase [Treponemataceae bacterium]